MKKSQAVQIIREVIQEITKQQKKKKGVDGKACWDGYRYAGTENGKDKCVSIGEDIQEVIKKEGDKFVVYPKNGGKRLGTHSTRAEAEKQLAAIEISKHKTLKEMFEEREISYKEPNFKKEWEEAQRYPEFKEMGEKAWVEIAKKGSEIKYSSIKDVLGNVDLNFNSLEEPKRARFEKAFAAGTIEMSIAVKFNEGDYDLVAGNTRLAGLLKKGIDPTLWVVDISHLSEMISEGIDDPVKPGILKKRLGKLSCSKVRAERSKLEDKGTHYAKALQRYLNYHCG